MCCGVLFWLSLARYLYGCEVETLFLPLIQFTAKHNKLIKGARSYVSKFSFLFHLENHHSKDVNFKFQLKRSSCLDVRSNFAHFTCLYLTVLA